MPRDPDDRLRRVAVSRAIGLAYATAGALVVVGIAVIRWAVKR